MNTIKIKPPSSKIYKPIIDRRTHSIEFERENKNLLRDRIYKTGTIWYIRKNILR